MHIDLGRKVTLDDGSASYLTFILIFFFFFSMITSSTAHEKSYPTWRRKGIYDFLCVNGCGHIWDLTLVKGFNRGKKDVKKLYYSKTH